MNNIYIQSVRKVTFYKKEKRHLWRYKTKISDTPRGEDGDRTSLSPEQTQTNTYPGVFLKKKLPKNKRNTNQDNTTATTTPCPTQHGISQGRHGTWE